MKTYKSRYIPLDLIRGIAIVLMVIFHLCFNLNHFDFIHIDIYNSPFWKYFRYVILSLFLLCVGASLYLANKNGINLRKTIQRFSTLFLLSLLITIATYFIFPKSWIYFGVLHFIAFSSLLGLIFIRIPLFSLFVGFAIIIAWNLNLISMSWLYSYLKEPLHLPLRTEDLVSLTPWFGVVLIGIFTGSKEILNFSIKESNIVKNIATVGQKSLLIYILHQPILFGTIFLLHSYQ